MSRPRLKKDYDPERVRSNASSVKDSLDLNATKIARATGVTRQTVSSIMSGKMEASPRWVEAFCVAYHIDREWLNGIKPKKLQQISPKAMRQCMTEPKQG